MAVELIQRDWIDYLGIAMSTAAMLAASVTFLIAKKKESDVEGQAQIDDFKNKIAKLDGEITLLKNDYAHSVKMIDEHGDAIKDVKKENQEIYRNLSMIIMKYFGRDKEED